MSEGLPQEDGILGSALIARGSCGEPARNEVQHFREPLRQKPFPGETIVSITPDSAPSMARARVTERLRSRPRTFLRRIRTAYLRHLESPSLDDQLFSSHEVF
jgi:hypothetical protein